MTLFDEIRWRDPLSAAPLEPIVTARTPAGVPLTGALRVAGTNRGYPIVDCVARMTPELAAVHRSWLEPLGLEPPAALPADFQAQATVDSFGWQWTWNPHMRSEADLRMRVAEKFDLRPEDFRGQLTIDAGAGAGDQSRFLLANGASVLSVDLSEAIEVVSRKLRMNERWFGVQGDVTRLPLQDGQFDVVYCEGVIQHTRDSVETINELKRVARTGGRVLATHYIRVEPKTLAHRMRRRVSGGIYGWLRSRLSTTERFKLLLITGNLAALSYVPVIGAIVRKTGAALYYDLMPEFRSTWTNTFDLYGNHSFQRFTSPEEFPSYFETAGMRVDVRKPGVVVATRIDGVDAR